MGIGTSVAFFENQMNYLHQNLEGKTVLVSKKYLNEDVTDRRFKCEGGNGCYAFTNGEKIFGTWVSDGEKDTIGGGWVESLVTE